MKALLYRHSQQRKAILPDLSQGSESQELPLTNPRIYQRWTTHYWQHPGRSWTSPAGWWAALQVSTCRHKKPKFSRLQTKLWPHQRQPLSLLIKNLTVRYIALLNRIIPDVRNTVLELKDHLGTALTHRVWVWVVLCGAKSWTWWSLWVPSNLGYSMIYVLQLLVVQLKQMWVLHSLGIPKFYTTSIHMNFCFKGTVCAL